MLSLEHVLRGNTKYSTRFEEPIFMTWITVYVLVVYCFLELPMKPRFYNLGPTNYNNQDVPKIDGLVNIIIAFSAW